jgi:orotate phosphoribosyltransferase
MTLTPDEIDLLRARMQACFRYDGPYTLASGQQANYYYDGKGATQDPPTAWIIGRAMLDPILESGAEAVGGPEIGSIFLSDAVGLAAHIERGITLPTFVVRKQPKGHGTRSQVSEAKTPDGSPLLRPGRKVAIVEDVITTGGSIQKAIDVLRELECEIALVFTLVERHESGDRALRGQGFPVLRLFYTDEDGRLYVDEDFARRTRGTPAPAAP